MSAPFAQLKRRLAAAAAVALLMTAPAGAQALQQQHHEVLNELKAIRQLLEKLAVPLGRPGAPVPAAAMPVNDRVQLAAVPGTALGRIDAPLTMVEFTDLQCPFCRRFHTMAFEQIKKNYIDTGKLRYISRDLPLPKLHSLAMTAARASRCAADQGRFWEMRHSILLNNAQLTAQSFSTFAQDLGMNVASFGACAADASAFQAEIQKDTDDAALAGITGTPSFVIGRTIATGLDGVRLVGAQPYAVFDTKLKQLLAPPIAIVAK